MLRKILLVALGFYLGYKAAGGTEIEVTTREPTLEEVMVEAMKEGTPKRADSEAR